MKYALELFSTAYNKRDETWQRILEFQKESICIVITIFTKNQWQLVYAFLGKYAVASYFIADVQFLISGSAF